MPLINILTFILLAFSILPHDGWAIPNPAAVYCTSSQHELLMVEETGFCRFSDNSYCEEWHYFRGECIPGQHFIPNKSGTNSKQYCLSRQNAEDMPLIISCRVKNEQLMKALGNNSFIDTLNLNDYHFIDNEKKRVFSALKNNKTVKSLVIQTPLTEEESFALTTMLKVNQTLSSLILQSQQFSLSTLSKIVEGIGTNKTLIDINLDNNGITDNIFYKNFPRLLAIKHVKMLSLRHNQITCQSLNTFIKNLEKNKTLLILNVGLNPLGNECGKVLLGLVKQNQTLIDLGLEGTGVEESIISQISHILKPRFKESPCLKK
ncbi:MAG: hypothetical protein LEGION0398_MBIBDBAK_00460 [Legionellaceae bacterium]